MSAARVVFLCGLLLLTAVAQSGADEVDDLLAGKPVVTKESPVPATSPGPSMIEDPIVVPLETATLADAVPWDATIGAQSRTSLTDEAPAAGEDRKSEPAPGVNLVPEPSAFVLATLALLYFLIFFRRRHFA